MDEQLQKLEEEIRLLKEKAALLEQIRNANLELINQRIRHAPVGFAAQHPILSTLGALAYKGAKGTGQLLAKGAKGYVNLVREEQERAAYLKQKYPRAFKNKG